MTSPNTPTNNESKRNIGASGATGVVVAAMIGTGIFTLSGVVGPDLVTTDHLWWPGRGGHRCGTWRKRVQRIGGRQSQHRGTLFVLANHVWPPSHVHSMCHRFGSGRCGLGCRGGGGKRACPLLPARCKASWANLWSGRTHLDCHRNAHPLGSFGSAVVTPSTRCPKWHPSCLRVLVF